MSVMIVLHLVDYSDSS